MYTYVANSEESFGAKRADKTILLRCDMHKVWDDNPFALVPKGGASSASVLFHEGTRELYHAYHNLDLQPPRVHTGLGDADDIVILGDRGNGALLYRSLDVISTKLDVPRIAHGFIGWSFKPWFITDFGQPGKEFIDHAIRHALLRQGHLGIKVKTMRGPEPEGKAVLFQLSLMQVERQTKS
ncbi:hypothetical protein FAVG1_13162 [Fusarium avenaceum]|nr:hypothetical protein FAVG1_13162 [Fusarium avenaceum]